ncbi:MAG: hypothetical protein P4L33_00450 [Capsulimonadaceae bacterium]|nr:hypothetical protein [Capsulimonadaceae bacterium]
MNRRFSGALALIFVALATAFPAHAQQAAFPQSSTETIVLIRHGEKTAHELGQLSGKGLNRALALPNVLIGKFGKPDYIFAPNPSATITSKSGATYCYIRPLATIEPTAIRLGMPVNTLIGFGDIQQLQNELVKPIYANAVVFVAWEHVMEDRFAKNVMQTYAKDSSLVPDWPGSDYDSIFVIRLARSGDAVTATFTVDREGLNDKLTDADPTAGAGH